MGHVFRFAQRVILCVSTLLTLMGTMYAQDTLPNPAPSMPRSGIPEDWSTRHVIYTRNGSVEDMLKLRNDPRFLNSMLQHYVREHRSQIGQPATAGLNEDRPGEPGLNNNWLNENTRSEYPPAADTQNLQPYLPSDPIKYPRPIPRSRNRH